MAQYRTAKRNRKICRSRKTEQNGATWTQKYDKDIQGVNYIVGTQMKQQHRAIWAVEGEIVFICSSSNLSSDEGKRHSNVVKNKRIVVVSWC